VTKKEFVERNWQWTVIPLGIMFSLSIAVLIYSAIAYLFGSKDVIDIDLVKFCGIFVLFSGPFYLFIRFIKSVVMSAIDDEP